MSTIKFTHWIGFFAALITLQSSAFAQSWGEPLDLQEFLAAQGQDAKEVQGVITNARLIEEGKLWTLKETPWSSDFWPDMKGSIADPYNETGQGSILGDITQIRYKRIMWATNKAHLEARLGLHMQVASNINAIPEAKFDNMSPAEKYDMLMGDTDFTMTNRVIEMVEKMDSIDLVAAFTGVCHGWSPASLTMPRPEHVVTVMSPLGRKINFYPMDIKALASFLWGKTAAGSAVHFEGSKCISGGKKTKYGRLLDPKCFNINPALFHLVAVNQLGLNHRGFVVDRSDNKSVWNQPVYAFQANYFRVTDRGDPRLGLSLDQAKVMYSSSAWDALHEFRSPKTSSIVGVQATFWYSKENMDPDHSPTDSPSKDKVKSETLRYDLELDANDNIVGGEWREFKEADAPTLVEQVGYTHPNSIWLVPEGVSAYSPNDYEPAVMAEHWDPRDLTQSVPKSWQDAAKRASKTVTSQDDPKNGNAVLVPAPQPLGEVVNQLIEFSRTK